ncbi:glycosyltransferase [Roseisolibacter agri]|uniref:Glycosyl transferase n=1 Tax=Roseisolibacter agri TaxID=2014610 RepID=A0AA37Q730_9BACT|nr:glycosyltransferase [Roseisolibacter agri]GLC27474.1 glycosyl transferase [Roseisolibacter agri]
MSLPSAVLPTPRPAAPARAPVRDGPRVRVLHVITGLQLGGAEMMLWKLVTGSDRGRFAHEVASMTGGGAIADRIAAAGIPVHLLGDARRVDVRLVHRLRALVRRSRPHLLQGWMYHGNALASVVGLLTGVPTMWNLRTAGVGPHTVADLSRFISRQPTDVITNSERAIAYHEGRGYRPRAWHVIPNGFDLGEFRSDSGARARVRASLGVADDAPLVGTVARFDPMKDYPNFLQAAAHVRRRHPAARFALVGPGVDGSNAELAGEVRRAGLDDAVHLMGARHDVAAVMSAMDVYVQASLYEGFPNTVGEAMACGLPCAVTDAGDSGAVVGDAGRVVPVRDPAALGEAVSEILALPASARATLGARARARAEREFALHAVVARYETLYEARAGVALAGGTR